MGGSASASSTSSSRTGAVDALRASIGIPSLPGGRPDTPGPFSSAPMPGASAGAPSSDPLESRNDTLPFQDCRLVEMHESPPPTPDGRPPSGSFLPCNVLYTLPAPQVSSRRRPSSGLPRRPPRPAGTAPARPGGPPEPVRAGQPG